VICSYFSGIGSLTAGTVGLGLLITLIVRPGHAEAGLDQPDQRRAVEHVRADVAADRPRGDDDRRDPEAEADQQRNGRWLTSRCTPAWVPAAGF
jgi:hypothetical protein